MKKFFIIIGAILTGAIGFTSTLVPSAVEAATRGVGAMTMN